MLRFSQRTRDGARAIGLLLLIAAVGGVALTSFVGIFACRWLWSLFIAGTAVCFSGLLVFALWPDVKALLNWRS